MPMMATVVRMPATTIAIRSSMRVKPFSPSRTHPLFFVSFTFSCLPALSRWDCLHWLLARRTEGTPLCVSGMDLVVDAVHRRDLRDRDEAHDTTDEKDHGRLEVVGDLLQPVVELALVEDRGGAQLLVERTRALTDADHLAGGGGEDAGVGDRTRQPSAAHHELARLGRSEER